MKNEDPSKSRIAFLMAVFLAFAFAIAGRAAYLQLAANPRLEQMARRQFQSKMLIRPRRGPILDRNGEPLAISVETQSLAADPSRIGLPADKRVLARLLARAVDLPYGRVLQRLSEKREFVWIKRHLSEPEMARLRKWRVIDADGGLIGGLWLVRESRRAYPHGDLAAQVLGSVNVDDEGAEGVELWQNERLRGRIVSMTAIKDALGRPAFIDTVAAKSVQDGEPVTLTLDASLQYAIDQQLRAALHRTGARAGQVVVMNAVNGEVLALANDAPGADRRRNRAFTDGYEPGSTMKAVLAAAALSRGWKLTDQVWGERGHFRIQGHTISEAEAREKFEWISLKKIIQVSSNIGAAKVALKLGADAYFAALKAFGFGARTDSGFPGEISGRVPPRKAWQPLALANIAFGQGVLVTPIQMARAYAALLNGGWLVQPTLLDSREATDREPPRRIVSQKVSEQVIEALKAVTQKGGTGLKAVPEGYDVAGKTGTAQVVEPTTGRYSRSKHNASFIGFAVGVEPKIVVFAALEEPKGSYFAAETAAPLFREALAAVASRFSMPSNELTPSDNDRLRLAQAAPIPAPGLAKAATLEWLGASPRGTGMSWRMPQLRGLTPREAARVMQGHGFALHVQGFGLVRGQSPEAGKTVADGETVKLTLGEP